MVARMPVPSLSFQSGPRSAGRAARGFVERIVRHADDGALGQVGKRLVLVGMKADRPDAGIADGHDLVAVRLDLIFQIRQVLEGVGVDFFTCSSASFGWV